jgi:hypothetical protein
VAVEFPRLGRMRIAAGARKWLFLLYNPGYPECIGKPWASRRNAFGVQGLRLWRPRTQKGEAKARNPGRTLLRQRLPPPLKLRRTSRRAGGPIGLSAQLHILQTRRHCGRCLASWTRLYGVRCQAQRETALQRSFDPWDGILWPPSMQWLPTLPKCVLRGSGSRDGGASAFRLCAKSRQARGSGYLYATGYKHVGPNGPSSEPRFARERDGASPKGQGLAFTSNRVKDSAFGAVADFGWARGSGFSGVFPGVSPLRERNPRLLSGIPSG